MEKSEEPVLSNELVKEACLLSIKAHTHNHQYVTKKHGGGSSIIFGFKGSEVKDLYPDPHPDQDKDLKIDHHFGQTNVDCKLFPSLLRIGEGQLAKVNESFLKIFQDLLEKTKFREEVEEAVKKNKKIILTGHSFGGAIASLATLWILDEYTRKPKTNLPIGCVTFGSPLIGDGTLTHAVRREKWAGHFTHFVMEHDIVPRIMLAPKTSIQQHLPNILNFYQQKVNTITTQKSQKSFLSFNKKTTEKTMDHDQLVDGSQAVEFFENVLVNASTVASHDACDLMEPTNSLKEKLAADFVKVSPYRPFGVYVFCTQGEDKGASTARQQLAVENPNAVLQLLFYFLQLHNEDQDLAQFAVASLTENLSYYEELNNNGLQLENQVKLEDLNKDLWTSEGTTGDAVRTRNKALFELSAGAKWCLLAVEEAEKRKKKHEDEIKVNMRNYKSDQTKNKPKIIEDMLDEIFKYKEKRRDGEVDYYEAFKLQNDLQKDFEANVNRLEQAKIWDVVIEMVIRKDLPDEFEAWSELVELGTWFRRLCEPLDIANYYRHAKGDDTAFTYMKVRPKRYKFTQRWYEHANAMGFESDSESNFVAELEELMKEVIKPKNKTIEEIKRELEDIKNKVKKWESDEKIKAREKDVYWGKSVLIKLEQKLAEAN